MISSKQRSALSALAQNLQPIFQVGKNGITDIFIKELGDALDARELVKISVQKSNELKAKDVLKELCDALKAEPVSCVGFKITLYRKSKKSIKHIDLDE